MRALAVCVFLFCLAAPAASQQLVQPGMGPRSARRAALSRYLELQKSMLQSFRDHNYAAAADLCRQITALVPDMPDGYYNLACALARQGKVDEALSALRTAVDKGWVNSRHTLHDEDLAGLRDKPLFMALVAEIRAEEQKLFMGVPIPGVRTETGDPEEGLRYRVRMGTDARRGRPNRLIVWMHPSGGSMNEIVEKLAPALCRHGFALMVMTDKNFLGWSGADGPRLLQSIEDVGQIDGIDAKRPLLFGYSAGGQMAIQMWLADPSRWGGVILDAAYPVDISAPSAHDGLPLVELPDSKLLPGTPLFIVSGDADGGTALWKQVESPWRKAGVPLTVRYVPNRGHEWLFDVRQFDALLKWLDELRVEP